MTKPGGNVADAVGLGSVKLEEAVREEVELPLAEDDADDDDAAGVLEEAALEAADEED